MRMMYLYSKVIKAWHSGTLFERIWHLLLVSISRPFVVVVGYLRLSSQDRKLDTKLGFMDHRSKYYHHRSNSDHIKRIIASYKAAKESQHLAELPFQIRGIWSEWIEVNYKKLVTALNNEDVDEVSHLLENHYREQFTTGTGGYDNYIRYRKFLGNAYIKYVWAMYRNRLLDLDYDINQLSFPFVGNPTGVMLNNGCVISIATLRHAYHAVEICEILRDTPHSVIVEIGGGLGGQAYQTLLAGRDSISKYVIFDIPEVAVVSSYFLLSALPERRVRLYGEAPISVTIDDDFEIAVFPHFSIVQLPDTSVDLFYNSCSFSEMDSSSAKEYLSIIERSCRKYFMHDNHDKMFQFKTPDGSISSNITGSKLLPNSIKFKRVFKKPRVHGLPEDISFRHFEYLYEVISLQDSVKR